MPSGTWSGEVRCWVFPGCIALKADRLAVRVRVRVRVRRGFMSSKAQRTHQRLLKGSSIVLSKRKMVSRRA
jgi:hypothetical protein